MLGWNTGFESIMPRGHEILTERAVGASGPGSRGRLQFLVRGQPVNTDVSPAEVSAIVEGNRAVDVADIRYMQSLIAEARKRPYLLPIVGGAGVAFSAGQTAGHVVHSLQENDQRHHALRRNRAQNWRDALNEIVLDLRAQHRGILAESDSGRRLRKIGAALHLIQDSYCPAHTERSGACIAYVRNYGPTTRRFGSGRVPDVSTRSPPTLATMYLRIPHKRRAPSPHRRSTSASCSRFSMGAPARTSRRLSKRIASSKRSCSSTLPRVAEIDMPLRSLTGSVLRALLVPPYRRYSDVYDDVMGHDLFDWVRRQFAAMVRRHRIAFESAADLGCGTGLFARYLSRAWRVPVFGVDRSPAMLRVAADRCRGSAVSLLRQDIRRLRLPRQVDLITANVDTINHLLDAGEIRALFRRVHDHLREGGHFVFDFLPPCGPQAHVQVVQRGTRDGAGRVTQRIRWNPRRRLLTYRVLVQSPRCSAPSVELHAERTYEPRDIARWLAEVGFVIREVLDADSLRRANACPRRVVVVAQKKTPCAR